MGQEVQNASPTVFIWFQPNNFIIHTLVMRECWLLYFLAICEILKMLWHFEILTWKPRGIAKISSTASYKAKSLKIWNSGGYEVCILGTFHVRISRGQFRVIPYTLQNFRCECFNCPIYCCKQVEPKGPWTSCCVHMLQHCLVVLVCLKVCICTCSK